MERSEAIEVLKDFWSVYEVEVGTKTKEAFETLIPEIKVSEDERIRKEIVGFLDMINKESLEVRNFIADRCGDTIPDDMIPTWIAWIEGQGEHIKFLESIQIGDEVTRNPDGVLVNLSQLKRMAKQGLQNLANSAKTCKDGRKPAESSLKDKEMVHYISNAISEPDASAYLKEKNIKVIDAHIWLENLLFEDKTGFPSQWKPSEEQLDILKRIVDGWSLSDSEKMNINILRNDLNALCDNKEK